MQTFLSGIIGFFSVLAGFSGIAGGIILIINGDWILLLQLFFAGVIIPFIMAFAMMPSLIFAGPGAAMLEQGNNFFGSMLVWLSTVYLGAVFGIWSSYVLFYVFENTTSFWGAIFASFGTAIGPIIYMTSKNPIENDQDAISNMTANLSAEISLFVMIAFAIFYGGVFFDYVTVYVVCFSVLSAIFMIMMNQLFKDHT